MHNPSIFLFLHQLELVKTLGVCKEYFTLIPIHDKVKRVGVELGIQTWEGGIHIHLHLTRFEPMNAPNMITLLSCSMSFNGFELMTSEQLLQFTIPLQTLAFMAA